MFVSQFSDGELAVRRCVHAAVEMCARTRVGMYSTVTRERQTEAESRDEGSMISTGAQGMLDAGLVSLCVEKLVQEDTTELKVCMS